MKKKRKVTTLLSVFELLEMADNFGISSTAHEAGNAEVKEDYLHRGERILSMLKEKAQKKKFVPNSFLDMFNMDTYHKAGGIYSKAEYLVKTVRQKLIAPSMDACMDPEGERLASLAPFEKILTPIQGVDISNESVSWTSYEGKVVACHFRSKALGGKNKHLLELSAEMYGRGVAGKENRKLYLPFPSDAKVSAKVSGNPYHFVSSSREVITIDAGKVFAEVLLANELKKQVGERLKDLSDEQKADNKVYCYLRSKAEHYVCSLVDDSLLRTDIGLLDLPWFVSFVEGLGYRLEGVSGRDIYNTRVFEWGRLFPIWLLSSEEGSIPLVASMTAYIGRKVHWNLGGAVDTETMVGLFDILSDEYQADKEEEEYRKELRGEYTKSYQNLKSLSGRYLAAMENSAFNKYFGFVEFDSDCILSGKDELAFDILNEDGEKIGTEELIHEFSAIAELFGWGKQEEVSLRFRKLGNHHASGLYYPVLKCLCVDVRVPSSMLHEYFHMLDYEHGEISRGQMFSEVIYAYKNAVLSGDKKTVERLRSSKSKYGLDYYFKPTEIFARCGEMYLLRSLGIRNALVVPKPEHSFAYPQNDVLMDKIEAFFDQFLGFDRLGFLAGEEAEETATA